jgi:hypothetical protein
MLFSESSDSDSDAPLAATLLFQPGHFACNVVWQTHFVLHPRLRNVSTAVPRPGQPLPSLGALFIFFLLRVFKAVETGSDVLFMRSYC